MEMMKFSLFSILSIPSLLAAAEVPVAVSEQVSEKAAEIDAIQEKTVSIQHEGEALESVVMSLTENSPAAESASEEKVLVRLPAFFDFIPYLTTKVDVETVFGKKARFFEDGPLGKRHIITEDDFEMGVKTVLVFYTADDRVSDLYMRIPATKRSEVMEKLVIMTKEMDPEGFWTTEKGQDVWLTRDARLSVQKVSDTDFSIEYGATARIARETRAWLESDPDKRCPRFSGLSVGWTTVEDLRKRVSGNDACRMSEALELPDGSQTYTLNGSCFGIPGEQHSYLWFGADTGRLKRLLLTSRGDAEGFSSVLPALKKRYKETAVSGKFETIEAPSRNVWPPEIRFDAEKGQLEFLVHTDGVRDASIRRDELLAEKKAREEQARRVDSLFE